MSEELKISIASGLLALFGLFLLWQGFTKSKADCRVLPRWMYLIGGLGMLALPLAYFILVFFVVK